MGILPAFRRSTQGGAAMSEPPYRALRIVLGFLSLLLALGGLLLIFTSRALTFAASSPPTHPEFSTCLSPAAKRRGGMLRTLSAMWSLRAGDRNRNGSS